MLRGAVEVGKIYTITAGVTARTDKQEEWAWTALYLRGADQGATDTVPRVLTW
jgi:hypothetical protein